jgi:TRAP-type C4-dicarboxylate transport system substrate-binding protein
VAPSAQLLAEWAGKIEEASGGAVKFTIYYSSALFEMKESLESVKAGICDITGFMGSHYPTLFQLDMFVALPFLLFPSPTAAGEIRRELYDKYPELQAEYKDLQPVIYTCFNEPEFWAHTTDKGITKLEDFAGMDFLGMQPVQATWLGIVGATPVNMGPEDIFVSMERGLIEGELGGFGMSMNTGTIDLHKYHTRFGEAFDMVSDTQVMNIDTWNSLPPDIQKIFFDVQPWYYEKRIEAEIPNMDRGIARANELGAELLELEPGELQKIVDSSRPMHEDWIADIEASGKPARAFYDDVIRLIEEYKNK